MRFMSATVLEPIRRQLRRSRTWVAFRGLQHEGWSRALRRWRRWIRILGTPPVVTDPLQPGVAVELHLLCHQRDYLTAIWALKSFYHYSGASYPLVLHLQGPASRWMLSRLRHHFPTARIIPQTEADPLVEHWLASRGLTRLLEARRRNPYTLKLTDFLILGQGVNLLSFDSDVLFFRRPEELLPRSGDPVPTVLFQRDPASNYLLTEEQARNELGIDLVPRVNVGIMLFARERIDLHRCDEYLAHPAVGGPGAFIDQTVYALAASEQRCVHFLPETYLISLAPKMNLANAVARHYAGLSRPSLTDEGIPYLIDQKFFQETLQSLGAKSGSSSHQEMTAPA